LGTPKDVVAKLNAAVMDAPADPGVRQRLADLGQIIVIAAASANAAFAAKAVRHPLVPHSMFHLCGPDTADVHATGSAISVRAPAGSGRNPTLLK